MRILIVLALALAGCAAIELPLGRQGKDVDADCRSWFEALDEAVDRAGVRDAEADRLAGFPALRVNRLTAALAPRARSSDEAFSAWLQQLQQLDASARQVEIANLPGSVGVAPGRLGDCSQRLTASITSDPVTRGLLLDRARVPDRYSTLARAAGLYAFTRVPFFAGVRAWERDRRQAIEDARASPRAARRLAPEAAFAMPPNTAPAIVGFTHDAIGLPRIDAEQAERLLAAHAPVFDIETQGAFDAIGAPAWGADGHIGVDALQPVVYQRLSHTLVRGQALVQLVYTLWFPERPRSGNFDLLSGTLDGVILRITLAPDGRPLMLDTIHACGCYHLFFPAPGVTLRQGAPANEEWAFVPAPLPDLTPGSRFVVRIASATHYVLGVSATAQASSASWAYRRRPEAELRRLPLPQGGTRSLYGPDGLVAGSERDERFLFWPMGIASAGAMRQWGHHATAFVGRRHFDDADLIERRFEIEDMPPPAQAGSTH